MTMAQRLLSLLVTATAVAAYLNFPHMPAETAVIAGDDAEAGDSPLPTAAPLMPRYLEERDTVTTFFSASDSLCGYINGSVLYSLYCDPGEYCELRQTAAVGGNIGCCLSDVLPCGSFPSTCYNAADVSSGVCDAQCQADTAGVMIW
jgi:hypothetical protein